MKVCVLNDKFEKASELDLPARYAEVNPHNLYLYVKSYQASMRANTAHTKGRSDVSGGGKKPWRQKGRGGARAGSTRTNVWVGGAVAFGPTNNRNYFQKVNKKQKRLAFERALADKANANAIFAVDNIVIESGKTKDARAMINKIGVKDALIVKSLLDEKTLLAFRNLANCYVVDITEVNAYLLSIFNSVIIEKDALASITKEG
ncbi:MULTISPECIES: 50S ribosomal protein L4 [unclassified Campylobacter]|uniref:50S ribosomal protein L4 n=2 Tax=Campylobacter TaxID=194 RepID=UPI001BDA2796|nr:MULTISPECIES: 50S ribosomal protein L4 [unclassified Campylobacter]MBZ7975712.1 50S ribosomal protein L4 [Campylobacter sp. RM12637]MBZ7978022.1 50S ribosomal protein L4 [Campylobacter sp. RM12654]MBZ7979755.1 50S ribosomal protein L4 [Campylobacter sp. RM12642]MBZ7982236.1 50S ribosomal protein L4 [Campylobacter sp. RM12640]MBZ7989417.1 50S ribosomal protein L4 [Campylobacter sp. RM12635]MBZ7992303.1 50S ribosomal protein L4 [Campylobacter sp. RM9333]MBZ8007682.1 50S ribosomal protein L4